MAAEDVAGDLGGKTLPARQREVHRATHRRRDAAGGAAVHRASKVRSGLRWPLLLVAMPLLQVASLFLVVRPGAPSSVLAPSSDARSP